MAQLTIAMIPGLIDLPDTSIAAHDIAYEDSILKICENGKFSAVRHETIFMGYYRGGDTIGTPLSPVDGYQYSPFERRFAWSVFTTRGAGPNFVSGQALAPTFALGQISLNQSGQIYLQIFNVDDVTGLVSCATSYFAQGRVAETITTDGIVRVLAICQRQSLNT